MVAFVGAQLARQWAGTAVVVQPVVPLLLAVYLGVVISDLVTYALGAGLSKGLFRPMRRVLFPEQGDGTVKALKVAKRFGRASGILQRFLIGLRGPICLAAGFTGIPVAKFAAGAALLQQRRQHGRQRLEVNEQALLRFQNMKISVQYTQVVEEVWVIFR